MTDEVMDRGSITISWIIQTAMLTAVAVVGYFIDDKLDFLGRELEISRVERAQIRQEVRGLEIGLRGDRFTRTDWNQEKRELMNAHNEIGERLRELERKVQ